VISENILRPSSSSTGFGKKEKKIASEEYFRVMKENKEINKKMKKLNLGGDGH
jgi:hypothetical protein